MVNGRGEASLWADHTRDSPGSRPIDTASRRLSDLQRICLALTRAVTAEQVVNAIVDEGMAALRVNKGVIALLSEDGTEFHISRTVGYPHAVARAYRRIPADALMPIPEAVRLREPIFLETSIEREERFPSYSRICPPEGDGALAALPLVANGHALGCIGLAWPQGRLFDVHERTYMTTVVRMCGAALDRARLTDSERRAWMRAEEHEAQVAALNERLHRAVYESSHRVKNHLQMLAGMVELALLEGKGLIPAAQLERLGHQIRMLAGIHDLLTLETKADAESTTLSAHSVLGRVLEAIPRGAGVSAVGFRVAAVPLPIQTATALALILNELVSNAIKHGGKNLDVVFRVDGERGRLEVRDDGPGFPAHLDLLSAGNTGLDLVRLLTRADLRGEEHFLNRADGGACAVVEFPLGR